MRLYYLFSEIYIYIYNLTEICSKRGGVVICNGLKEK